VARKKAKRSKKDAGQDPVGGGQTPNGHDAEIVRRRENAVSRLRVQGYRLRQIADTLLEQHMSGDTPLFQFVGPGRKPLDVKDLPLEEARSRAYEVVSKDMTRFREREEAGRGSAVERLADNTFMLEMRLLTWLRDADEKRRAERDTLKFIAATKECREIAIRLARLQGIETERPIELKLPERYRVYFDDDGVLHQEKLEPEKKTEEGEPN
jgi:hypothetical protein